MKDSVWGGAVPCVWGCWWHEPAAISARVMRGGRIGKSRGVVVVSCAYRHVAATAESSLRACVRAIIVSG
jgi:hypothetical protein